MLELQRNMHVLRRWWWLIVIAAVVGAAVAYGATKLLTKTRYEATAIIALAPPPATPNGLAVTSLGASADAELLPTLSTALEASKELQASEAATIRPTTLSSAISGQASVDGQLLFASVTWPDAALAPTLANAVAAAYMKLERARLAQRYAVIHRDLQAEEARLAALIRESSGRGQAASWLQSQYAATTVKLYDEDASARTQLAIQGQSMQIAQPASADALQKVGARGSINAALGAILGILLALVFAFVRTSDYGRETDAQSVHPVLTKVGD